MFPQPKDMPARNRIFDIVRSELLRVRREQAPDFDKEIRMESSLVVDLGLDSLSLVEAVVGLEQALRIPHLSLEALSDCAATRYGGCLTVGSLVNLCIEQSAANGPAQR